MHSLAENPNTIVAFPSVLFVKGESKEIPYKITSKKNPDIVKGMLKVKNYEF